MGAPSGHRCTNQLVEGKEWLSANAMSRQVLRIFLLVESEQNPATWEGYEVFALSVRQLGKTERRGKGAMDYGVRLPRTQN